MSAQFHYIPSPEERGYYGALFQAADVEKTGSIAGARAVEFFKKSKLDMTLLKHIWAAADQPISNTLDPRKFAVAVRLIQLEQNNLKPNGPDLANVPSPSPMRPAFFEGFPPPQGIPNPPTPPRPPADNASVAGSAVAGSVATNQHQLAVQDPYTLPPAEQARYEQLFPQYCQDKQFMTGKEAVDLFTKSGLPQPQLAQIWNMVDSPVDNKLDKLEFAIAMHLIVCISKKNLPMPPALPMSLKQLKSQQKPPETVQIPPPEMNSLSAPEPVSMSHPPSLQMSVPPPVSTNGSVMGRSVEPAEIPAPSEMKPPTTIEQPVGGGASTYSALSGLQGPPPIRPQGTVGISDAFEGLGNNGPTMDTGSIASFGNTTPIPKAVMTEVPPVIPEKPAPTVPDLAPQPKVETTEPAIKPAVSAYQVGESQDELEKLRSALQKLQAENISLKAKMGTMTEEEQDVQKELGATVAEITTLSSELTTLRAQVLASKSRLVEATAELKAAKEKKGVVSGLIVEAQATKTAIDEAYEEVERANEAARAAVPVSAPVPAPVPEPVPETDFFGAWGEDAPAVSVEPPAPLAVQPPVDVQPPPQAAVNNVTEPPQNDAAPFGYSAPPQAADMYAAAAPQAPTNSYGGSGFHNRNASAASGFGEVMGGAAPSTDLSTPRSASFDGIPATPSMREIEDLKSRSKEAEDVARDAEETKRQLAAELEELRRVADEAESKSRAATEKPKKKGLLRRGGKTSTKEIQKLANDARDKKDSLLKAQARVKDAEALAAATRKEAENIRKEADDAQVRAATAASMQQAQPPAPVPAPVPATNGYGEPSNGYQMGALPPTYSFIAGEAGMKEQSAPMGMGNGQPPLPMSNGQPAMTMGGPPVQPSVMGMNNPSFNSNVMSSGGMSIPTPSNDPYSNPFE